MIPAVSLPSPPSRIRNSSDRFKDQVTGTNTIGRNFLVYAFELQRACSVLVSGESITVCVWLFFHRCGSTEMEWVFTPHSTVSAVFSSLFAFRKIS